MEVTKEIKKLCSVEDIEERNKMSVEDMEKLLNLLKEKKVDLDVIR